MDVNERLKKATCAYLQDGNVEGTAWLLGREGHLITAGHLLPSGIVDNRRAHRLSVRFEDQRDVPVKLIQTACHLAIGLDFAVLFISDPNDRARIIGEYQPLQIKLDVVAEGDVVLRGYGDNLKPEDQKSARGKVVGCEDWLSRRENRVFKFEASGMANGFSGAAVYSESASAVIAIQSSRPESGGNNWYAMPLYRILPFWQELGRLCDSPQASSDDDCEVVKKAKQKIPGAAGWNANDFEQCFVLDRGVVECKNKLPTLQMLSEMHQVFDVMATTGILISRLTKLNHSLSRLVQDKQSAPDNLASDFIVFRADLRSFVTEVVKISENGEWKSRLQTFISSRVPPHLRESAGSEIAAFIGHLDDFYLAIDNERVENLVQETWDGILSLLHSSQNYLGILSAYIGNHHHDIAKKLNPDQKVSAGEFGNYLRQIVNSFGHNDPNNLNLSSIWLET